MHKKRYGVAVVSFLLVALVDSALTQLVLSSRAGEGIIVNSTHHF